MLAWPVLPGRLRPRLALQEAGASVGPPLRLKEKTRARGGARALPSSYPGLDETPRGTKLRGRRCNEKTEVDGWWVGIPSPCSLEVAPKPCTEVRSCSDWLEGKTASRL